MSGTNVSGPAFHPKDGSFLAATPQMTYGILCTLLSTTTFFGVNLVAARWLTPSVIAEKDKWRWRNVFVSWVHAPFSGMAAVAGWLIFPEMINDMPNFINYHLYTLTAYSAGYFIFDFLDILWCRKVRACWEVTLHHIMGIPVFVYLVLSRHYVAYVSFTMLAEVNSFFLHSRKLLQMMRAPRNMWYHIVIFLNLLTFALFRGIGVIFGFTWSVYNGRDQASLGASYLGLYVFMVFSVFVIDVMNIILFWRLLKMDVLRVIWQREKTGIHLNNNDLQEKKKL